MYMLLACELASWGGLKSSSTPNKRCGVRCLLPLCCQQRDCLVVCDGPSM